MNRKEFLKSVSVLATGSLVGNAALGFHHMDQAALIPIIDTHQHLADFNRFGRDWAHPPVEGNYGMDEYKQAIKGLNIVKAVYMEVAAPAGRKYEEALYALEICKDRSTPTAGAVIYADLYKDDFKEYVAQFKNSDCIKGVRAGFRSEESLSDNRIIERIRFLGKIEMRLDFIVPPVWFPSMAKLIKSCPDTKFQADHCANADPKAFLNKSNLSIKPEHTHEEWRTGVAAIAAEKNVVCKISGLVSRMDGIGIIPENLAPTINACLDIFGPDRVMFAGDWPWCLKGTTLENWVNLLKQVVKNRPVRDQRKLFYDNAVRHYKI